MGRLYAMIYGFSFLYISILVYTCWKSSHHYKSIYPIPTVPYNDMSDNKSNYICHDPVQFIYDGTFQLLNGGYRMMGILLHKNMINAHGFKNVSCVNQSPNTTNLCAKYDNNLLHTKKELCNGGYIYSALSSQYILEDFTKSHLNKILSTYCNIYHKTDSVCNFKLLTFNMDYIQQRIEFITKHIDCTKNYSQTNKTWLFKEFKHRGEGIHIYNNHQLIYSLLQPDPFEEKEYYNKCANISRLKMLQTNEYFEKEGFDYIAKYSGTSIEYRVKYNDLVMQEFVSNQLLIENRVFHIRTLHLLAYAANQSIVLQFPKWIILRNPNEFDNSEPLTLRSNLNIAKKNHDLFRKAVDEGFRHAWGYNHFMKFIEELYNFTNVENKLQNDMQHIANIVFKARKFYNRHIKRNNKVFDNILRFDIACMDTILNNNLELKLLEMNFGCGFTSMCEGYYTSPERYGLIGDDKDFCALFANETSDILIEIYEKQKHVNDIKSISSLDKFKAVLF